MFRLIVFLSFLIFIYGSVSAQETGNSAIKGKPVADTKQEIRTSTSDKSSQTQQQKSPNFISALERIEAAIRDLIAKEDKIERERKQQNEIRDLDAQENMALWAERMFWATLVTAFLTFLALGAIMRTLHHTRRAADASYLMVEQAKNATTAAENTTSATREIGEMQTSAFIKLDARSHDGGQICIQGSINNAGQSIANNISLIAEVEYFRDGEVFQTEKLNVKQTPKGMLGVNGSDTFTIWGKLNLLEIYGEFGLVEFSDPGSSWIKVKVICTYMNAFRNWWISEYDATFHFTQYSIIKTDVDIPNIGQSSVGDVKERVYKSETQDN